jgi:hypothetical protein
MKDREYTEIAMRTLLAKPAHHKFGARIDHTLPSSFHFTVYLDIIGRI